MKKPSTKYRQTLWMGEGTCKSHIWHAVNIQNTSYMSSLCILGDTIKPTNQPSRKPARLLNFLLLNIVFSLFKWTGASTVCSQMHLFHKLPMGAVSCDQNHKNNQSTLTIQILLCFVFLFNQTIQPGFPTFFQSHLGFGWMTKRWLTYPSWSHLVMSKQPPQNKRRTPGRCVTQNCFALFQIKGLVSGGTLWHLF